MTRPHTQRPGERSVSTTLTIPHHCTHHLLLHPSNAGTCFTSARSAQPGYLKHQSGRPARTPPTTVAIRRHFSNSLVSKLKEIERQALYESSGRRSGVQRGFCSARTALSA